MLPFKDMGVVKGTYLFTCKIKFHNLLVTNDEKDIN